MFENLLRFDKKKKLTFLDFETENLCLHPSQNLPWQVGLLQAVGDDITHKFSCFIKWHRPLNVGEEAAKITHYDAIKVAKEGVEWSEVVPNIVQWTREADFIIGHNILGFDIYLLSHMYDVCGYPRRGIAEKMIDTHAIAKGIKLKHLYDPKKETLLEYQYKMINTIAKGVKTRTDVLGPEMGIEHDYSRLHDALVDIELNFKIWQKLKFEVEI